jgi:sugar lactone lactonase YvrE
VKLKVFSDLHSEVGEGPLWNDADSTITWVDITGMKWHQLSLISGKVISHSVPNMIGAIVEKESGGYLAAVKEGFATCTLGKDGYVVTHNFLSLYERMNDAKADAKGRWWAGSNAIDFTAGAGRLHRLNIDGSVTTMIEGLTLPNGLGWSPDNKYFYIIDTFDRKLFRYDFDLDSGEISNKRVLVEFKTDDSYPDGMCVAKDGSLLVAMWNGSRIEVISEDGKFLDQFEMPVKSPTSCTFGGPDGKTLIITSDGRDFDEVLYSDSGKLFGLTEIGLSGTESNKFHG